MCRSVQFQWNAELPSGVAPRVGGGILEHTPAAISNPVSLFERKTAGCLEISTGSVAIVKFTNETIS